MRGIPLQPTVYYGIPMLSPAPPPRAHLIAASCYLLLALAIWLPYSPHSGMSYETSFAWTSETTPFPASLEYLGDPLRVYTEVFYDLGYRLSQILGIRGSYLGFQIVFLFLLWARGFFLYLALAALAPEAGWIAFLAGAFSIVHAADLAAMWVGQMNQLGYMFWLVLGFYALVRATEPGPFPHRKYYAVLAVAACYLSLFSYESPLFLAAAIPVLLAVIDWPRVRAYSFLFLLWYISPAALAWRHFRRKFIVPTITYQDSVTRHDLSPAHMLTDWAGHIRNSLAFWDWGAAARQPENAIYGYAAAAIFVLACWLYSRASPFKPGPLHLRAFRALPLGLITCALSFPAYLFLDQAGGLWRTQFLSSFGAAITLASLILLAATLLGNRGALAATLAAAAIIQIGVHTLADNSQRHLAVWDRYRRVMSQFLAAAPQVKPGSVLILTGIPPNADPFGDNMWFDLALRLAYPGRAIAGYYLTTGQPSNPSGQLRSSSQLSPSQTPSRGANLELDPARPVWHWDRTAMPPLLRHAPASQTAIFEWNGATVQLLPQWPSWLPASETVRLTYDPTRVVLKEPASPIAINRYGSLPPSPPHNSVLPP